MSEHVSLSQLNSWLACGERYRLDRIDRAQETPAAWSVQGTAYHQAIEYYEFYDREPALDQIQQEYLDRYDEQISYLVETTPDLDQWMTGSRSRRGAEDIDHRRALGVQQVELYYTWSLDTIDQVWTLPTGDKAVEVPFELDLDGLIVKGQVDQVLYN